MRIVVTGGLGFIGSHFVEQQLDNSNEVIVIDSQTYASNLKNLSDLSWSQIKYYKADISNSEVLHKILRSTPAIDWIVNFAAESHVDRSIKSSELFFQTNITGVINILEYLMQFPETKFLQVSTDEVYGSIKTGRWSELEPLMPNSPYSASKASAELICHAFKQTYGIDVVTTRCANNFGSNQALEKLIPKVIYSLSREMPVEVYGTGENIREWIYVKDHVSVLSTIIQAKSRKSFTYNIGGIPLSNLELITKLASLMNTKPNFLFVPDRLGHDYRYSVDDSLVKTEFNLTDFTEFESNLVATINWYLDNPMWTDESLRKINS